MVAGSHSGRSPRERVEAECALRGTEAVHADCLAVLRGETNPEFLVALVGAPAEKFFDGAEHHDTYWFRVWALRALLWSWDPAVADDVPAELRGARWDIAAGTVRRVR